MKFVQVREAAAYVYTRLDDEIFGDVCPNAVNILFDLHELRVLTSADGLLLFGLYRAPKFELSELVPAPQYETSHTLALSAVLQFYVTQHGLKYDEVTFVYPMKTIPLRDLQR